MIAFLEQITNIDKSIFFFFNGMHSPYWDVVMTLFTRTECWTFLYASLIYFIAKRYRLKAILILIMIGLLITVADQFSGLIKDAVQRFRPTHDPAIKDLVHHVLKRGGLYGYFSAHAANTFAVAKFTSMLFKNSRYRILIFFWAIVVSYTRIYVGVHFPLDVLTGALVGLGLGFGAYKLLLYIDQRFFVLGLPNLAETKLKNKDFRYILLVFVILVLTILLVVNRLQHFNWIQL